HGDAGELELRSGPLEDELRTLASEGVQSLLLEGGPTIATAFVRAGLVDKLLLFVAPVVAGEGPRFLGDVPVAVRSMEARRIGDDVLLQATIHEP
ncbi:MAG: RibD family protein, partial [Gaiellaceae bacterium]